VNISPSPWATVVARAQTFTQRLQADPGDGLPSASVVDPRLQRWRTVVAGDDETRFRQRLACDGLDVEDARLRRALGPARVDPDAPLPPWAMFLEAVAHWRPGDSSAPPASDASLPFEDVFLPFVAVARDRLRHASGAAYERLPPSAHATLERTLLRTLTTVAAPVLAQEFAIHRAVRQSGFDGLLRQLTTESSRVLYDSFVTDLHRGGFGALFLEYSVLGRLLGTSSLLWIEAHAEFLVRLDADWAAIAQAFDDRSVGTVTAVAGGLSDRHRGGRTVIAVTFSTGTKIAYKPKPLATEVAFQHLLRWMADRGGAVGVRPVVVLDRGEYGWVEWVEAEACPDADAVARYYERAGTLLCLLYILGATDCHYENLVASGEVPVLVDLETVLHGEPRPSGDPELFRSARFEAYRTLLIDSVLRTGLLPRWEFGARGESYEVSGLGAVADQPTPWLSPRWTHINTDGMRDTPEKSVTRPRRNFPTVHGRAADPADSLAEILTGFRTAYQILLDHREFMMADAGPLQAFRGQRVRFVARSTRAYFQLLHHVCQPASLREGVDWEIELEILRRPGTTSADVPQDRAQIEAELDALQRLDIPYFSAITTRDVVIADDGVSVVGALAATPLAGLTTRLQALGAGDLARQEAYITAAFAARQAIGIHGVGHGDTPLAPSVNACEPLSPEVLRDAARGVADDLRRRAIVGDDGSLSWITLAPHPETQRFQLEPIGPDLYGGATGIALFFATLATALGSSPEASHYADLARHTLRPLLQDLRRRVENLDFFSRHIGVGGASGTGGLLYGLTSVARCLRDEAMFEDAARVARLITPEQLATDGVLDVVGGSAGALLGLAAFHDATGDRDALARAVACGDRLLEARQRGPFGLRAWPTLDGELACGFSHGASGIAYALVRLYRKTGTRAFLEAAEEGLEHEHRLYVEGAQNWPRAGVGEAGPTFMSTWCHGAPGIGLARLGVLDTLSSATILEDLDRAIATTMLGSTTGAGHLCCGHLGRADVLLTAGRRLGRPDLEDAAQRRLSWFIETATRTDGYHLSDLCPPALSPPGMFQGLAGVGYSLLRFADPAAVPSVLLWE